jgi:two-component system sensor histidine kinase CpxA
MLKLVVRLYPRILLWLLLNVVLLVAGGWMLFQWQFRGGVGGLLGGLFGDRLHSVGRLVHESLSSVASSQWSAVLSDFSGRHRVDAALVTLPFEVVAGRSLQFPPEVVEALRRLHREGQHPMPGSRPWPPPTDRVDEREQSHPPPRTGEDPRHPPPRLDEGPRHPPPHEGRAGGDEPMPTRLGSLFLAAGSPRLYYAAIRMPINPQWPVRQGPLYLVIATPRITGNGLFLEVRPWILASLGAFLISALWWLPLVRSLTQGLKQILAVTGQIAMGRFEARVASKRADELGALARGVDSMAGQIQGLVAGQKRFLGDIAHELCSPIARMEVGLELLSCQATGDGARRLAEVREELRQMSRLVDELLSFSRSSAQDCNRPLSREALGPLVAEAVRIEGLDGSMVDIEGPTEQAVLCNRELLLRALGNVLRNARRHAPQSRLCVRISRQSETACLQIADQGPGVPADALGRLFEPFYRVDGSRQAETGGTGLGLAIVKSAVEAFGGSVRALSNEPSGLIIELQLPCA